MAKLVKVQVEKVLEPDYDFGMVDYQMLAKVTDDMKNHAKVMPDRQARYLVNSYYLIQKNRIRCERQIDTLKKFGEPFSLVEYCAKQFKYMEAQVAITLDTYSKNHPLGKWPRSICGIGPVLAAGLLAFIDVRKTETAGGIWRFAGIDPTIVWNKGELRPYNQVLKTILYKCGESFIKVRNNKNDVYGKLYFERKEREWAKNMVGEFADSCKKILTEKNFDKNTEAFKWMDGYFRPVPIVEAEVFIPGEKKFVFGGDYSKKELDEFKKLIYWNISDNVPFMFADHVFVNVGSKNGVSMLCPAHIHSRARRFCIKIFTSHYFDITYRLVHHRAPPRPFILEHPDPITGCQHVHMINAPNQDDLEYYEDEQ